jgi:hypothetical protein
VWNGPGAVTHLGWPGARMTGKRGWCVVCIGKPLEQPVKHELAGGDDQCVLLVYVCIHTYTHVTVPT